MALSNPTTRIDTTFSAADITSAATVYTYTATADVTVRFQVALTNAAGNGDYVAYLTLNDGGSATDGPILPKTTLTAASGVTYFWFATMELDAKNTDVVKVWVDGLGGDNSVNGIVRIFSTNFSLFDETAALPDSIAADGSRPTVNQALLMLTRFLMERSVSSTTMTVKKEDGSTANMTFTLDNADNPTSITRAS